MNKAYLMGLLLTIIVIYGCAIEQKSYSTSEESQYRHKRITLRGFTFTPPDQPGWIEFVRETTEARLGMSGSNNQESYAVIAQTFYIRDIESREDLLPLAKQQSLADLTPPRYKLMSYEGMIDTDRKELCAKAHTIIEDRDVPGRPGGLGPMIMESHTLLCGHPQDRNAGIVIGYSQRYDRNGKDDKFNDTANQLFKSLEFTDLPKRQSPEQTDPASIYKLAVKYATGDGVPQDTIEAIKLCREAAELDVAEAQHDLGALYEKGNGVTQNYTEAVKWFRAAAQQGYDKSQNYLGNMYREGKGVTLNHQLAIMWYMKAAEQNYAMAQANLGSAYVMGQGVPQDNVLAYMWYALAVKQGLEEIALFRDRLSERMTSAQLDEAKKLVQEWMEQHHI